MEMYQDGVAVYVLLENAVCKADEFKRSPLDIDICPFGYEMCTGDCDQYEEVMEAWNRRAGEQDERDM